MRDAVVNIATVGAMPAFFNDPNHWREQARKTRAVASQVALPEARETLLKIAAQYDDMAQWAESRVKNGPDTQR